MGVLIQIKDVPEEVHRTLKTRAAASGQSLTEYLKAKLVAEASRPSPDELHARIMAREQIDPGLDPVALIRELRDAAG